MIGKLKGTIDEIGEDNVLIDVHGVCYVVFCPARTLAGLGSVGEAAVLHIETFVREDQLKLYGFSSVVEREWFRLLQSVQGVGAKVALAVLSTLSAADLANAIALQDKAMIARRSALDLVSAERHRRAENLRGMEETLQATVPALVPCGQSREAVDMSPGRWDRRLICFFFDRRQCRPRLAPSPGFLREQ